MGCKVLDRITGLSLAESQVAEEIAEEQVSLGGVVIVGAARGSQHSHKAENWKLGTASHDRREDNFRDAAHSMSLIMYDSLYCVIAFRAHRAETGT